MNRWLLSLTLFASLAFGADLAAHGGTYRGPGDTVPPGGGATATPTTPAAPAAPAAPASPATPSTPSTPATPTTPTVPSAPTQSQPNTPATLYLPEDDLTRWVYWWEFNKEPYLNLKAKVHSGSISTGENELLTGLEAFNTSNNTFKPTAQQITSMVIPALRSALETEDNVDIQSSAMIALAKIGLDPTVVELFQPLLQASSQEIRETAALAYGILQDPIGLSYLEALAFDMPEGRAYTGKEIEVSPRTRAFATYGLGLQAYAIEDLAIRDQIADSLWKLLSTDQSAVKDIRVAAVIALGLTRVEGLKLEEIATNLSTFLADSKKNWLVRAHCPNAIAKLVIANGSPEQADHFAREFLGYLAKRSKAEVEVLQSTTQAIGMLAPACTPSTQSEIFKTLVRVEKNGKDLQQKNFSAISLAYLGAGAPEGSPIRNDVIEFLMKNTSKGSTNYRPWAGLALGVMAFQIEEAKSGLLPEVAAETVLARFKKESDPGNKSAYAISLGLMKYLKGEKAIAAEMKKSRQEELRGYCAVALGLMGARDNREYISEMVIESRREPTLLQQASIALGLMNDHEVVDILLQLMNPTEGRPVLSVLSAAATAIGFIGDHRSVAPLVDLLGNDGNFTPLGRAFAAVALGLVADKEMLPWNSKVAEDLNYRAAVSTLRDQAGTGILDIL